MPTHKQPSSKDADAQPDSPGSPFPRYEGISERLAENESPAAAQPRELEIPRTESYGELWRRAQVRRHRSR